MIHVLGLRSELMKMYIKSIEIDYGLEHKDIKNMTDKEIRDYIDFLEELHGK